MSTTAIQVKLTSEEVRERLIQQLEKLRAKDRMTQVVRAEVRGNLSKSKR